MIRFNPGFGSVRVFALLAAGLVAVSPGQAQTGESSKKFKAGVSKVTPTARTPLAAFDGPFDANHVQILSVEANNTVSKRKSNFNLALALAKAWDAHKDSYAQSFKRMLEKQGLHDVQINLIKAGVVGDIVNGNKPAGIKPHFGSLVVDPKKKGFTVQYTTFGHSLSARSDVPLWFDPTLKANFAVDLLVTFEITGSATDPLVPSFAKIHVVKYRPTEVPDITLAGASEKFSNLVLPDGGAARGVALKFNSAIRLQANSAKVNGIAAGERQINGEHCLVLELNTVPLTINPLQSKK